MPIEELIVKLNSDLQAAEQLAWCVTDSEQHEIQLTISALMYGLEAIWQPHPDAVHIWKQLEPSLPSWAVSIASGGRLLKLASWYHYATSKRLSFPQYRISSKNSNLQWENFSAWLDEAFEIKAEWESGKDRLAAEDELRRRTAALLEVKAENIYKRIDLNKVWNWVDVQMKQDSRYAAGRRETFKTIFMRGDQAPEEWTIDDIEDVHFAITETCDLGNDISFFINNRLRQIRAVIEDFYSSFTLLSNVSSEGLDALDTVTAEEKQATQQFFSSFDKRASELEQLPDAPKRESFASYPKYLQAQAQWNILKRRYDARNQTTQTAASKQAAPQTGEQA